MVALSSCAGLPPAPAPTAGSSDTQVKPPVFAIPDEAMEYRVQLRGITVGRVQVALGQPGWIEGKHAIKVLTRGESDGFVALFGKLAYELESTIDLDHGFPIVDREEIWAEIAGTTKHDKDENHWESDDSDDIHSAVGRFRGWHAKPGEHVALRVRIGGHHLEVLARQTGRDYIAGAKAWGVRFEGTIADRFTFSAWVSDDRARVPLQFDTTSKWGSIHVDLVAYRAP